MPSKEEIRKEKALKLFIDIREIVINLYSRYLDEKYFEDINDYGKAVSPEIEKIGGKLVKFNKRPFGFDYELSNAKYRISLNSKGNYSYKRIG
jgi:hypothetical protein